MSVENGMGIMKRCYQQPPQARNPHTITRVPLYLLQNAVVSCLAVKCMLSDCDGKKGQFPGGATAWFWKLRGQIKERRREVEEWSWAQGV